MTLRLLCCGSKRRVTLLITRHVFGHCRLLGAWHVGCWNGDFGLVASFEALKFSLGMLGSRKFFVRSGFGCWSLRPRSRRELTWRLHPVRSPGCGSHPPAIASLRSGTLIVAVRCGRKATRKGTRRNPEVQRGNRSWCRALELAAMVVKAGGYFIIEHPRRSKAWALRVTEVF